MSKAESNDDGWGCLLVIAIIFVALGVGHIWSAAYGFLTAGLAILFVYLVGRCQ